MASVLRAAFLISPSRSAVNAATDGKFFNKPPTCMNRNKQDPWVRKKIYQLLKTTSGDWAGWGDPDLGPVMIHEVSNNVNTLYPSSVVLGAQPLQYIGKQLWKRIDVDHLLYQLPHFLSDFFNVVTRLQYNSGLQLKTLATYYHIPYNKNKRSKFESKK